MPYVASHLAPISATSSDCAVAWVRFWLQEHDDVPTEDLEYLAACLLDAVSDADGTVYYRPHVTADRLYRGDVTLATSRKIGDLSVTQRDPAATTAAWLAAGQAFDRLIPAGLIPSGAARLVF